MIRKVCKGKLHRLTVTQADLEYMGSITLDKTLMDAANIRPYEMVQITNLANAAIWHTYAIEGTKNTGEVCLNGPPARLFQPGDKIIVLSLGFAEDNEDFQSAVVFVDDKNHIVNMIHHRPWAAE